MILIPLCIEKCVFSHRFSATALSSDLLHYPTISNIYFDSSLKAVVREPTLCKFLTFHNPNLISIFRRLGSLSKESVQARGSIEFFVTNLFFTVKGVLSSMPNPQAGGAPLVICMQLLIQYICCYPP
jgi:hypothetical protein